MGQSNSIEQQQKSNEAFQKYIDNMNKEMEAHLSKAKNEIDALIESHYKPYPDKAELQFGSYSHLATVSEWSLNSISKIVDGCKKAIFGASPPTGTKKEQEKPAVSSSIAELKERELFIANAAFDVIQGILTSFDNKTSTSIMTKTDAKPLAPGMMLFISVMENSFNRKDFFSNETIVQNMFIFKVYYSIKEGEMTSRLSDLQVYEDQKASFRKLLRKYDETVANLDVGRDDFLTLLQKYTNIAETLNKNLENINVKIAKLSSPKDTFLLKASDVEGNEASKIVARITEKRNAAFLALTE